MTQDFDVSDAADVVWQVSATGTDELGRSFETQTGQVTVLPPVREPAYSGPSRLEIWGGPSYNQFLGCLTCNEFSSESVFNQFGRDGSRFSSYSVCNEFANSPPRVIDATRNVFVGELTLNQFRSNAWREPVVVAWLREQVCG